MFIGQIILNRRKELNMTQKQLAEKLNVTDRTISRWECGVSLPDVEMLKTVAKVLEVDITYFYEDVKEKEINYTEEYDFGKIKKFKINSIIPFVLVGVSIIMTLIIEQLFFKITLPLGFFSNTYRMIKYAFEEGITNQIVILIILHIVSFLIATTSLILQLRNNISFKYFYKEKMFNKMYISTYKKMNIPYFLVLALSYIIMIV